MAGDLENLNRLIPMNETYLVIAHVPELCFAGLQVGDAHTFPLEPVTDGDIVRS